MTKWSVWIECGKNPLQDYSLPLKCHFVMINVQAHPSFLEDSLLEELNFIKVKFLPLNTTPHIQPMDKIVISNFKKLYTKQQRYFEVTSDRELSLRVSWKKHFNIPKCINLIDKVWQAVISRMIYFAWKKLFPGCLHEKFF